MIKQKDRYEFEFERKTANVLTGNFCVANEVQKCKKYRRGISLAEKPQQSRANFRHSHVN